MIVTIGGSRHLTEENLVTEILLWVKHHGWEVVTGCASGIDTTVRQTCFDLEISCTILACGKRDGSDWGSLQTNWRGVVFAETTGQTVIWSAGGLEGHLSIRLSNRTKRAVERGDRIVMITAPNSIGSLMALKYARSLGKWTKEYRRE